MGLPLAALGIGGSLLASDENKKKWKNWVSVKTNSNGAASVKFTARAKGTAYSRWYRPASSTSTSAYTTPQKVIIK